MSCSCAIEVDHDGGPRFISESYPVARKKHKCCECGRSIPKGEKYEYVRGCWDGYFSTYRTCLDCESIRKALFCSYIYTMVWEDLASDFCQNPEVPSAECMMSLTPAALEQVCDLIESYWEEEEE